MEVATDTSTYTRDEHFGKEAEVNHKYRNHIRIRLVEIVGCDEDCELGKNHPNEWLTFFGLPDRDAWICMGTVTVSEPEAICNKQFMEGLYEQIDGSELFIPLHLKLARLHGFPWNMVMAFGPDLAVRLTKKFIDGPASTLIETLLVSDEVLTKMNRTAIPDVDRLLKQKNMPDAPSEQDIKDISKVISDVFGGDVMEINLSKAQAGDPEELQKLQKVLSDERLVKDNTSVDFDKLGGIFGNMGQGGKGPTLH